MVEDEDNVVEEGDVVEEEDEICRVEVEADAVELDDELPITDVSPYNLKKFGLPQFSNALPVQFILQLAALAKLDPPIAFPIQHSLPYSIPKK